MVVALKKQRKLTNREKAQGIEPIIAEEKKEPIWVCEYRDFLDGKQKPVTLKFIERLGFELVEWAKNNESALRVCAFFDDKGIGSTTADSWVNKFPEFKDNYLAAKRYIGRRRETGAITKKYDAGSVNRNLYQFLPEEREGIIWQSKLKNEEQKENEGTKYIVFEKVPETTVVKPRRVENE